MHSHLNDKLTDSQFDKKFTFLHRLEISCSFSKLPPIDSILGQVNQVTTLHHITYLRCTFNVLPPTSSKPFKCILITRFPVKI